MKITIWGINYAPEPTGIGPYNTDLAEYCSERGHEVRAVTGFPYYPQWRKPEDARGLPYRREWRNGVEILRCWLYVPRRPNAWKRMVHEASFVFTSFWRFLSSPRPDVALVVSPPLLLGAAAWLGCLLKRCPYQFHVQDMQPDAALALGLIKPGPLTAILYQLERFAFRGASAISGITRGMLKMFSKKGVPEEQQYLFPNWIIQRSPATPTAENLPHGAFRQAHGLAPDEFLVLYSGNLGKKQGLDILLDAAKELDSTAKSPKVVFVIAGEGAAKEELQTRIEAENLPVRLLPLQPEPIFKAMLQDADLCLVTQQKGGGSLFFPSKLITILSAARPVVTVADDDSDLANSVNEGNFGRNVRPGDPTALARAITALASNPSELTAMATAGSRWIQPFSRKNVLENFLQHLEARFSGSPRSVNMLAHPTD